MHKTAKTKKTRTAKRRAAKSHATKKPSKLKAAKKVLTRFQLIQQLKAKGLPVPAAWQTSPKHSQKLWEKKLKKSGFEDIETSDKYGMMRHPKNSRTSQDVEAGELLFRCIRNFIANYDWKSKRVTYLPSYLAKKYPHRDYMQVYGDRLLLQMLVDGKNFRDMRESFNAKFLARIRKHTRKKRHPGRTLSYLHRRLKYLQEIAMHWNYVDPEGLFAPDTDLFVDEILLNEPEPGHC